MEGFNDLNDIIAFYMRKIKWFMAIVAVGGIIFAGMRGIENIPQYLNQDSNNQSEIQTDQTSTEEPTYKTVSILLRLEPVIDENGNDLTQYVVSAYIANKTNQNVVEELMDQYLDAEKGENKANRELLYSYGYILDKERNYTYNETDFISQLRVTSGADNRISNYVQIGFTSMNRDRAEEVAKTYESLLSAAVREQVGDFTYEVESENIEYKLPSASAGASSTRVVTSTGASVNTVISLSSVVKEIIKGAVWGVLLGFVVAVLVIAFWYLTSKKIQKLSDLKKYDINFWGIYPIKKRGFGFWNRIIFNIEGEKRFFKSPEALAEVIITSLENMGVTGGVMIAGSTESKIIDILYRKLRDRSSIKFMKGGFILSDAESIKACSNCKNVILVEQMGKSIKEDIRREMNVYNGYHVNVLGLVISE